MVQFNFCIHSIQFLYSFNSVSIFIQFSFYIHSIQFLYSFNLIRLYSFNFSSHLFNFGDWVERKFERGTGTYSKDGGGNERQFGRVGDEDFEVRSFFEHEISNQINFANSERHISEVLTHKDPIHTPIALYEFGLPKYQLQRLQYVQNTAARVVLQVSKFQHITPVLCELYWLPIQYRIYIFKILLPVYKSLNGTSPSYLAQKLHYRSHTRSLRSVSNELLMQPGSYTKTYGDRATSHESFLINKDSTPQLFEFYAKHIFSLPVNNVIAERQFNLSQLYLHDNSSELSKQASITFVENIIHSGKSNGRTTALWLQGTYMKEE